MKQLVDRDETALIQSQGPKSTTLLCATLVALLSWSCSGQDSKLGREGGIGEQVDGEVTVEDASASGGAPGEGGAGGGGGGGVVGGAIAGEDGGVVGGATSSVPDTVTLVPDTVPPTVEITAPTKNSTLVGSVALAASAKDNVGVAGVQFLLDNAPLGGELTQPPYGFNLDTLAVGNGSHTLTAQARDKAGNKTTSAPVAVTVANTGPSGTHPRIWLDTTTLQRMSDVAKAGGAQWTTLQKACNSYLGGKVIDPAGKAYADVPDISSGYQGSDYFDPLMNLGLCYQLASKLGDTYNDSKTKWGAKGADILAAMTTFTTYSRDSGYGIRFFGVGLALGFDWLYPALSSAQKSKIVTSLKDWLTWYDASGFGRGQSHSNYFAGYYATKAYAGIALEDPNDPNDPGAPLWSDFLNRMHLGGSSALKGPEGTHAGVQEFYSKYLVGGGWTEGWGYGPIAVMNMSLPSLAARTAKGLDLVSGTALTKDAPAARPYSYPLDNGAHLMHFLWPGRNLLDARDTLHEGNAPNSAPSAPPPSLLAMVAGLLSRWNHPLAPRFHSYAREVRTKIGKVGPAWLEFLFWDESAPEQPYASEPLSYLSAGINAATMRSDWSTTAVWASMRATSYVNNPYSGEQDYDAGALAIVKGSTPFLVNTLGVLNTSFPGLPNTYEDEMSGAAAQDPTYNTLHNGTKYQRQVPVDKVPPPGTGISSFEDGGSFVFLRADRLEEVYAPEAGVTEWNRDVVFLRPSTFVVYDRTTLTTTSGDQRMHWHVLATPSLATAPKNGVRYDVTNANAGFLGSMTTVLPSLAKVTLVNILDASKVYRLEVRPSTPTTSQRWLTAFDAAPSVGEVAQATQLTTSANVHGVLLASAKGNSAVLFPQSATPIADAVTFTAPAADTKVLIVGMAGKCRVDAVSKDGYNVTVQPDSGAEDPTKVVIPSSAKGVLSFRISATGAVTAK